MQNQPDYRTLSYMLDRHLGKIILLLSVIANYDLSPQHRHMINYSRLFWCSIPLPISVFSVIFGPVAAVAKAPANLVPPSDPNHQMIPA